MVECNGWTVCIGRTTVSLTLQSFLLAGKVFEMQPNFSLWFAKNN